MLSIKNAIPHRPPFLFLDEITELGGNFIKAQRMIRVDEPHFQGHYPGNPIMPGVLLCEATFQAAAVYLFHKMELENNSKPTVTPVLSRITDAKFKRMVKPGDRIEIEVIFKETLSNFHFLQGVVRKDGKIALTLSFALALVNG